MNQSKTKYYLLIILIFPLVIFLTLGYKNINSFTFSKTEEWDQNLIHSIQSNRMLINNTVSYINLGTPPKNSSKVTQDELAYLISLKKERTEEKVKEIKSEINIEYWIFDNKFFYEYLQDKQYSEFLLSELSTLYPITLYQKQIFDRARPYILDSNVDPILYPKHPAYPSGHATQAYFLAELFSLINPSKKEIYFANAKVIAHNREIAGVHYPSDSQAGKELAQQYLKFRLSDNSFITNLKKAKDSLSLEKN